MPAAEVVCETQDSEIDIIGKDRLRLKDGMYEKVVIKEKRIFILLNRLHLVIKIPETF